MRTVNGVSKMVTGSSLPGYGPMALQMNGVFAYHPGSSAVTRCTLPPSYPRQLEDSMPDAPAFTSLNELTELTTAFKKAVSF